MITRKRRKNNLTIITNLRLWLLVKLISRHLINWIERIVTDLWSAVFLTWGRIPNHPTNEEKQRENNLIKSIRIVLYMSNLALILLMDLTIPCLSTTCTGGSRIDGLIGLLFMIFHVCNWHFWHCLYDVNLPISDLEHLPQSWLYWLVKSHKILNIYNLLNL